MDAVLFDLEEVEGDRFGVAGLNELEAFVFEAVLLGFQEGAFVTGGGFELVEDLVENALDLLGLGRGEPVRAISVLNAFFDALGEDG